MSRKHKGGRTPPRKIDSKPGRVVETVGRRVRVRDAEGERVCFLSGQRAVIGDEVRWVEAPGEGGKLVAVDERRTALRRTDLRGKEQVLAANLAGLVVVQSVQSPAFRPSLLDRYLVAANAEQLELVIVVNKVDLGVPDEVREHLDIRVGHGARVISTSAAKGDGLDELTELLASGTERGPWAFVGGSGVGKTSLIARLLPDQDVGAIGDVSEYWGTGRHTTTGSILLALPTGGEIADSPGIRNFTPVGLTPETARDHFPGIAGLRCHYRDCMHRDGEDGCEVDGQVEAVLLASYRRLLEDLVRIREFKRK